MIQRRNFLGSLAALATVPALSNTLLGAPVENNLLWKCDVIRTIPQGYGNRAPVVTGVSIQPNGDLLAIVGDNHHIGIYDTDQSKFVNDLRAHTDWIRTAKFSPDGRLLATAGNDRTLKIWDTNNFENPQKFKQQDAIIDLAFSSDSQNLATVGFNSELKIYNLQNNRIEKRLGNEHRST
jgi:WD40 repeat protein